MRILQRYDISGIITSIAITNGQIHAGSRKNCSDIIWKEEVDDWYLSLVNRDQTGHWLTEWRVNRYTGDACCVGAVRSDGVDPGHRLVVNKTPLRVLCWTLPEHRAYINRWRTPTRGWWRDTPPNLSPQLRPPPNSSIQSIIDGYTRSLKCGGYRSSIGPVVWRQQFSDNIVAVVIQDQNTRCLSMWRIDCTSMEANCTACLPRNGWVLAVVAESLCGLRKTAKCGCGDQ